MLCVCVFALVDEGRRLMANIICWGLRPFLDFDWLDSLEINKFAKKTFSCLAYDSLLFLI